MSDLQNITFEEINAKLLLVLCANENILFEQYTLFNKTVDKFRSNNTIHYVSPDFKLKFLLILRSLMSKNNDITVLKKNNVYYAGYNLQNVDHDLNTNYSEHWIDKNSLNHYIIENNLEDELNYIDPENGNTLFHDLLSTNNHSFIEKVVKTFDINYSLKNNDNKTPIECISDIKIAVFVINDLNNKMYSIDKRIKLLESENSINKTSITQFLKIKFIIFIDTHFNYLIGFGLFLLLLSVIIFKLI